MTVAEKKQIDSIEAVALLLVMAKNSALYHDDREILLQKLEEKIQELLKFNKIKPVQINPLRCSVPSKMAGHIQSQGRKLKFKPGYAPILEDGLTLEEKRHYDTLMRFADSGLELPAPPDVIAKRTTEYQKKLQIFEEMNQKHEAEQTERQAQHQLYLCRLADWHRKRRDACQKWAARRGLKVDVTCSGKVKDSWIYEARQQGFRASFTPPQNPLDGVEYKCEKPTKPKAPKLTRRITVHQYIPGSVPEIEEALAWANTITPLRIPIEIAGVAGLKQYLCQLKTALLQKISQPIKLRVVEIFSQVLDRTLTDETQILEQLDQYPICYETAIGWSPIVDDSKYPHTAKQEKIKLSATGLWLVQFQSCSSQACFEIPYNICQQIEPHYPWERLKKCAPQKRSDDSCAIDSPDLPLLLKMLGWNHKDFPHRLKQYDR